MNVTANDATGVVTAVPGGDPDHPARSGRSALDLAVEKVEEALSCLVYSNKQEAEAARYWLTGALGHIEEARKG